MFHVLQKFKLGFYAVLYRFNVETVERALFTYSFFMIMFKCLCYHPRHRREDEGEIFFMNRVTTTTTQL